MKDTGLVTCESCGAKFDRNYGKCWKCGVTEREQEFQSENVLNPFVEEFNKSNQTVQNVLILAAGFVLMGAASSAGGLVVAVVIGFVIYFATTGKKKTADSKVESTSKPIKKGEEDSAFTSFPRNTIRVFLKLLAAMILLPICISTALFVVCGGYMTIGGLMSTSDPHIVSWLIVLIPMVFVAIAFFWVSAKALIAVFRS